MSTENMRKLIMLAESLDENDAMDRFPDDYAGDMEDLATRSDDGECPHCHGYGEYVDPEGFDELVHCPHCEDWDEEPIRKSRLVKDMAMDMDMDWTDLGLSDVEPEDLKGFPKINEAFTRKHFQMIADTLQKIEDPEIRRAQAEEYAAQFAADNPRFRRDLFMKAAGVEELDEVQTLPREIKDRKPTFPDLSDLEYETCPECGVEGGHENGCAVLGALYNEDLNEEQSEFRLKDIVGADNFAELVSDMNTGGIDYSAAYFTPLYWHFLDEYPDEIPVGSRTGRPEDPEQYVLDNLDRYHSEEIKQYMNTPDMDESNCGVCGETFKWEGSPDEEMCPRCTQEYLGENEGWFDDLGTGEEFCSCQERQA
jgi:hypothetical protein